MLHLNASHACETSHNHIDTRSPNELCIDGAVIGAFVEVGHPRVAADHLDRPSRLNNGSRQHVFLKGPFPHQTVWLKGPTSRRISRQTSFAINSVLLFQRKTTVGFVIKKKFSQINSGAFILFDDAPVLAAQCLRRDK